ncbi:fibrinogen-related molecule [Biomphalaria glabrata]|nr:hypothetical protein BgiMline_024860 [Biomphalaria glabrata]
MRTLALVLFLVCLSATPCQAQNSTNNDTNADSNITTPVLRPNEGRPIGGPSNLTPFPLSNNSFATPSTMQTPANISVPEGCVRGMYGMHCRYRCYCDPPSCDDDGMCTLANQCMLMRFGYKCQESNYGSFDVKAPDFPLVDGNPDTSLAPGTKETSIELSQPIPVSYIRLVASNMDKLNEFKNLDVTFFGTNPRRLVTMMTFNMNTSKSPGERTETLGAATFMVMTSTTKGMPKPEVNPTTAANNESKNVDRLTTESSNASNTASKERKKRQADEVTDDAAAPTGGVTQGIANADNVTRQTEKVTETEMKTTPKRVTSAMTPAKTTVAQIPKCDQVVPPKELIETHIIKIDGRYYTDVRFVQPVLIQSIQMKGNALDSVGEVYISGGIDFGPRGTFFISDAGYAKPAVLNDRVTVEDCVGSEGNTQFPEITFESNTSFILTHVYIQLDWSNVRSDVKGKISVQNWDKSIYWTQDVCFAKHVFLTGVNNGISVDNLVIKGDMDLPPVCIVNIYGVCDLGFYGHKCDQLCSPSCSSEGCDTSTGSCLECATGFYGSLCEMNCPSGCVENTPCHRNTGVCLGGCKSGKFPDTTCDQGCSAGCADDGSCDDSTLECKHGCKAGYYKKTCDMECKGCGGEGGCDQETGTCNGGCMPGLYGEQCNLKCSPDCESGCQMTTGICLGCPPGKAGDHCQDTCSNCAGDGRCDQKDKTCLSGCKTGFTGLTCGDISSSAFFRSTSGAKNDSLLLVGIVVAVGVILLIIVVVAGVFSMKKKPEKPTQKPVLSPRPPSTSASKQVPTEFEIIKDEFGTLV